MPEQLTTQEIEPTPTDPGVVSQYQNILNHPDTHPALRGQLDRLIIENSNPSDSLRDSKDEEWDIVPGQSVPVGVEFSSPNDKPPTGYINLDLRAETDNKTLASLADMTLGLKQHQQLIASSEGDFEGAFWPDIGIYDVIKKGDYTSEHLADFIHEAIELSDTYDDKVTPDEDNPKHHDYFTVLSTVVMAPIEKQQDVYHNANTTDDFRRIIENSKSYNQTRMNLDILHKLYDYDDVLELFEPDGPAVQDPLVQSLLSKKDIGSELVWNLDNRSGAWPEDEDPGQLDSDKRDWGDRFLNWAAGMSQDQRDELLYASRSRTTNPETGYVDTNELRNMLESAFNAVQKLGVEQVQKLRDLSGIVNLDYYSLEELELMSNVVNGDKATVKHLQKGDTTVVMTDAKGDYNASLRLPGYDFDTGSNRTLYFEINRASDFYRHMIMLNKLGIKPSTLVLSAHGQPGQIFFGRGEDAFNIVSTNLSDEVAPATTAESEEPEMKPASMHILDAKGLPRMVRTMMQDSRGIDDNPKAAGRRRIILAACYQAKPVGIIRKRPHRGFNKKGASSSKTGSPKYQAHFENESTAETIAKEIGPNVDVYAGHDLLAIDRTDNGIALEAVHDTPEGVVRQPIDATHTYLDNRGYLVSRRINSVVLRRRSTSKKGEEQKS